MIGRRPHGPGAAEYLRVEETLSLSGNTTSALKSQAPLWENEGIFDAAGRTGATANDES